MTNSVKRRYQELTEASPHVMFPHLDGDDFERDVGLAALEERLPVGDVDVVLRAPLAHLREGGGLHSGNGEGTSYGAETCESQVIVIYLVHVLLQLHSPT